MTPPAICPNCGGRMEYSAPDDPRQDDGTTETYFCEDCKHDETWYPEDELTIDGYDEIPASYRDGFDDEDDFDGYFEDAIDHEDYDDEAQP